MAEELSSTILLDGTEYNINAKTADVSEQVVNKLTIKKINLNNSDNSPNTNNENTNIFEFNGAEPKSVTIVPADGGRFTGRITVPSLKTSGPILRDGETVLNCDDIKKYVVDELQNNSVLYTWEFDQDTNIGTLTGGGDGTSIQSICIIYGADEDVVPFAAYNNAAYLDYTNNNVNASFMSAYIYISDDTGVTEIDEETGKETYIGNIYFGTCSQDTPIGVRSTADSANTAKIAEVAEALKTPCYFQVNLKQTSAGRYTGEQDTLNLGVLGQLQPANGGTGKSSLDEVTVGRANIISGYDDVNNLREVNAVQIYSGLEQANLTGRGLQDILNGTVIVPKAKTITTHTSTGNGSAINASYNGARIIISTAEPTSNDGNNGDIWIQYS